MSDIEMHHLNLQTINYVKNPFAMATLDRDRRRIVKALYTLAHRKWKEGGKQGDIMDIMVSSDELTRHINKES